jgi:hypothetical protein
MLYQKLGTLENKISNVWITAKTTEVRGKSLTDEEKAELVAKIKEIQELASKLLDCDALKKLTEVAEKKVA